MGFHFYLTLKRAAKASGLTVEDLQFAAKRHNQPGSLRVRRRGGRRCIHWFDFLDFLESPGWRHTLDPALESLDRRLDRAKDTLPTGGYVDEVADICDVSLEMVYSWYIFVADPDVADDALDPHVLAGFLAGRPQFHREYVKLLRWMYIRAKHVSTNPPLSLGKETAPTGRAEDDEGNAATN